MAPASAAGAAAKLTHGMPGIAESASVIALHAGRPGWWLPAWIAEQLRRGTARGTRLQGVSGEAMIVYGFIGIDAALTESGDIWVGEYDFDTVEGTASTVTWRRAAGVERLGFIVMAARQFFPLRELLPSRPTDAPGCAACRATGDWHLFSADRKESLRIRGMICKTCGGMGWLAAPPL